MPSGFVWLAQPLLIFDLRLDQGQVSRLARILGTSRIARPLALRSVRSTRVFQLQSIPTEGLKHDLRGADARRGERGSTRRQMQKLSAGKFYHVLHQRLHVCRTSSAAACGCQMRDDPSYLGTTPRTHHAVAVNLN